MELKLLPQSIMKILLVQLRKRTILYCILVIIALLTVTQLVAVFNYSTENRIVIDNKSTIDNPINDNIASNGENIDNFIDIKIEKWISKNIDNIIDHVIERYPTNKHQTNIDKDHNDLSVLWYTTIEGKAEEASGFMQESMNFLLPLHSSPLNIGWHAGGTLSDLKLHKLFKEFSKQDKDILEDLFVRGAQIYHELPYHDNVISVVFDSPYSYVDAFEVHRTKYSLYKIGRAMFETDWIPPKWEYLINEYLDELWVPSVFAKEVFRSAGIHVPITVIGEGFNPDAFAGSLTDAEVLANRKKFYPQCKDNHVVFLTVGNMDNRKGITILITQWIKSFPPGSEACLYIRSDMTDAEKKTFSGKGVMIYAMNRLNNKDLVLAYKTADVFVLPSHGEGWGRPIMEAMAAGTPVIVPLWSGITEFVKEDYAIPLHVTSLEEAFKGQEWFIGGKQYQSLHHWASINLEELHSLLIWCTEHRDELPAIGEKARNVMYANYTWDKISSDVQVRIQEIKEEMEERGLEYYRSKNKKKIIVRDYEAKILAQTKDEAKIQAKTKDEAKILAAKTKDEAKILAKTKDEAKIPAQSQES